MFDLLIDFLIFFFFFLYKPCQTIKNMREKKNSHVGQTVLKFILLRTLGGYFYINIHTGRNRASTWYMRPFLQNGL